MPLEALFTTGRLFHIPEQSSSLLNETLWLQWHVSREEGIFGMPVIFSPPQPINTAEQKEKTYPCKGKNTHNHDWNRLKKGFLCLCFRALRSLFFISQSLWKHCLCRLRYWRAKSCSDCFHSSLLEQTFKNSSNISSGLIELWAISGLPVSGNSPHPPYLCVNMVFVLLFMSLP